MSIRILTGDVRAMLATLETESVQGVATSPPYFQLRAYGTEPQVWGGDPEHAHEWGGELFRMTGNAPSTKSTLTTNNGRGPKPGDKFHAANSTRASQGTTCPCGAWRGELGQEPTPALFAEHTVEWMRAVRRVLRKDGVVLLNIGDSYAGSGKGQNGAGEPSGGPLQQGSRGTQTGGIAASDSLPAKNLYGIPWMVAQALQAPYYTGRIKQEQDRIWLAAMIDAEGCFYIHKRGVGLHAGDGYYRKTDTFSPAVEVCNTNYAIIERCHKIARVGVITTHNDGRRQTLYRWTARSNEARNIIPEIYPHLVAKHQQARIAYGLPSNGERASDAHLALKGLHRGIPTDIDFPEPPSLFEPGWILRGDYIWAKPAPMPESVTDRCTRSHEYIFHLTKSPRYFWNQDELREPLAAKTLTTFGTVRKPLGNDELGQVKADNWSRDVPIRQPKLNADGEIAGGNKRTVWTIGTSGFADAHFATFPPELAETMVKAISRPGDTVLDPFGGAGTLALAADRLGRHAISVELKPDYVAMQAKRLAADSPMFTELEVA